MNLSETTYEKLKYYVYLLIDPRNDEVFYVGKGKGSRILAHLEGESDVGDDAPEKDKLIRDIKAAGYKVRGDVLRHGLTEKGALEIESAVIDQIGIDKLTNRVKGHHSSDRGRMPLEEIEIMYGAEEVTFGEPAILLKIGQRYKENMSDEEMYLATKDAWSVSLGKVKGRIGIACSVYRKVTREVFEVDDWSRYPGTTNKCQFEGKIARKKIRDKYIRKRVGRYWKQGNLNSHMIVGPDPELMSDRSFGYDRKEKPKEANMNTEPRFEDFDELTILLKISERYRDGMSPEEIYRETKDAWTIRLERVKGKVGLACAVVGGVIKGVFKVDDWSYYPHKGPRRKIQFKGKSAPPEIWDKYIGKSVGGHWNPGERRTDKIVGPKQD